MTGAFLTGLDGLPSGTLLVGIGPCLTDFIDCIGILTEDQAGLLRMCLQSEWNYGNGDASDIMWRVLDCASRSGLFDTIDWNAYGLCVRDFYACIDGCL